MDILCGYGPGRQTKHVQVLYVVDRRGKGGQAKQATGTYILHGTYIPIKE